MAEDIGIVIKMYDEASSTLRAISGNSKAFNKDLDELERSTKNYESTQRTLTDRTASLRKGLEAANVKVTEARKEYKKLGDEASKNALDAAIDEQERLKRALAETTSAMKENDKAYGALMDQYRKKAAQFGGIAGSGGEENSLLGALGKAGAFQALGDAAAQAAGLALTSAAGEGLAGLVSSAVSGIASGAALGSVIPGAGPLIGAAAGGIAGAISGGAQLWGAQDDAFKSYYNGLYEARRTAADESITSGSSIAAQREVDKISFTTLLGDAKTSEEYLSSLIGMANTTPFLYDDLTAMSKTLATYRYGADSILPALRKIGDAGAALGMGVSDMSAVATALGRMRSSNKTTLEYLNILNDRGIGAVGYLAEAKGVSVGKTYDMISKGEISGSEAVEIILQAMEQDFSGSMLAQSKTFSGLSSTLEGLKQEVQNAGGKGYDDERKAGLNAEIAAFGGELGAALQKIDYISGQNKAYYENLAERYQREALGAVLLGADTSGIFDDNAKALLADLAEEYAAANKIYEEGGEKSHEAAIKMENLKERAEVVAQNAYDSSEAMKLLRDAEVDQIAATRELTAAFNGWKNEYFVNEEKSKGQAAGILRNALADNPYRDDYDPAREFLGFSAGLGRVPYDDFPALLHEGERVLTASEARAYNQGGGGGVRITMNGVTVREDADIERIGAELLERLRLAGLGGVYE